MSTTSSRSDSGSGHQRPLPADSQDAPSSADAGAPSFKPKTTKLDYPETTQPLTIAWDYTVALTLVHVLALLAFIPWLFSWTGVALILVGHLASFGDRLPTLPFDVR